MARNDSKPAARSSSMVGMRSAARFLARSCWAALPAARCLAVNRPPWSPKAKFIAYLRISTTKQGKSGLGLEAQRKAVTDFLNGGNWQLAKEFVEVESGKKADRPQLMKAFQACRVFGAKLVIAKLDRLSRDAHFLLGLEKAGVDFVAADMRHRSGGGICRVRAGHPSGTSPC
jgi:hypothetical protein